MYGHRRNDFLFNGADWFSVEQNQRQNLLDEIDQIDGNRLLNTSVDDLCSYLVEKYQIDVPVLHEDQIVADQSEARIDVSQDRMRDIRDRSRPFHITGTAVEVIVPFSGEADAFKIQPSTYTMNPPRAEISNDTLKITVTGTQLDPQQVRGEIDGTISSIKSYLENLRKDVNGLNSQIPQIARDRIEYRRKKLLEDQSLVSALGFPLVERSDATRTYTAPEVRRRITPRMPPANSSPYKPEPVLAQEDYEHILSVMTNMAMVMERSPSAFSSIDEEALRSHFLVQLNGHYEGQATGETFNYEGKTDILVRAEGKNIFIAECKYWSGPKKLTETIDQLLGYTSWRDTKVAIIIFNRQKNFSRVLEAIPEAVTQHPNFKRTSGQKSESSFTYTFAHRDDPNRELTLTVMAFDVPHKEA